MGSSSFTQLKVWQTAHQIALEIYALVASFPPEERYALSGQMKRAAVSIQANIAEGFGRFKPREKAYFYSISRGSAEELKSLMILARDLGFAKQTAVLEERIEAVCGMLHGLISATLTWFGR